MRKLSSVIIILSALAAGVEAGAAPSATVGLVHVDATDADTYYNYLAALPVFRYADGATLAASPLRTDAAAITPAADEDSAPGATLWAVGGPDPETLDAALTDWGIDRGRVVEIKGDVFAVASGLALNWLEAREVVVAPYVPDGDAKAALSASYAAALAASLNAPLLYTYTGRTPDATVAALRRLGVRQVYVVDFADALDDNVLRTLGANGRYEPLRLTTTAAVDELAHARLRQAKAKSGVAAI
jgi:hypothetical protein